MLRIFIGYDPRQPVAYQVCAHSVWKNATQPVSITRLDLRTLPIRRRGLTEFTYSRFLVPYLSGFEGQSLFLDSDILVRGDVAELFAIENHGLRIVDHQRKFERPSVMLFNNAACRILKPEYIDSLVHVLYDFRWTQTPPVLPVLALPKEWNHLVGYDTENPNAKIVHFTKGIPVWPETETCEFAAEWHACFSDMLGTVSHEELMGRSVHVAR